MIDVTKDWNFVTGELSEEKIFEYMYMMKNLGIIDSPDKVLTKNSDIKVSERFDSQVVEFEDNYHDYHDSLKTSQDEISKAMYDFGLIISTIRTIDPTLDFEDGFHMVNIINKLVGEKQIICQFHHHRAWWGVR